jgi:hypothetical protein
VAIDSPLETQLWEKKTNIMRNPIAKFPFAIGKSVAALTLFSIFMYGCGGDDDVQPKVTNLTIVSMSPESPANLKYYETDPNDRVKITFDYEVIEEEGVRIFLQARSSTGELSNTYYSPSPLYKGKGSKTVIISVVSDEPSVLVDKVRIVIKNADQSVTISETFADVNFTFSE